MTDDARSGWTAAVAVAISIFVVAMDQIQLPIGGPAIAEDLGTTVGGIQGAIALASLVAAPLYIAGAKLGDKNGKKRVFLVGLALYAGGALGAALAPGFGIFLIGWSVVRALGMVLIIPAGVGLLIANYAGAQRGQAFALYGVAGVAAALVAPILMGFSAQELTWRVPFFVVVGLVALGVFLSLGMEETDADKELAIDWVGTLIMGVAIASIILGGMLGTRYGWWEARRPFRIGDVVVNPFGLSPAPWLFLIGLAVGAAALAWFARRAAGGGSPLFDPAVFDSRTYAAAFPMAALLFLLSGAIPFTIPTFLQGGAGFDAGTTGLVMVAFSVGSMILGFASGKLLELMSPRPLMQLSIVVLAVGLGWLAYAVEPDVSYWEIALPMFVLGTAFGVIASQAPNVQLSALAPSQVGEGSGLAEVGKEIGIGLGTAIIGGILLSSALGFTVDGMLQSSDIDIPLDQREQAILEIEDLGGIGALAEAELPQNVRSELESIVPQAYSEGMRLAISAMFLVVLGAFVFASMLPRVDAEAVTEDGVKHSVADVTTRRT